METNDKILNNRYKIIGTLGDGAYGDVYKIQRTNHIGDIFALKILKDNESIEKFERETKILDILKKHPNILKLKDCEIDNDTMYIIMPYINHGNLKEYIKANGTLSEDKAKIFLTQMLDAIEHANNQKEPIFHKDIKPENILLHKEEENDDIRYILADWGLASAKSGSRSVESSGTLDYKPPEVYRRKRYKNSDIYSLGIVLHYTLTKNSPYGYVMYRSKLDEASIIFSHLQDEPDIDENLSHNMKTIISKMLIKEPNDRANIDQLRELLKDDARESFEMGGIDFSIEKEKEIERLKAHIEQLQQQNKIVTPIIKQNQPSPKQVQTFNK
ncbi:MAG: serine/threonine-protein kinase, partial [Campylobacterota bacterium]|nr:serine/threonine-protein kinase [Campylobacterota bacterium]